LRQGADATQIQQALANGTLEKLLPQLPVQKGSALFIPGGLVHAIGEGCLIYEVQQSSNTTYRFYDWGRVGADGKPRELHTEKALAAIDWSLPMPKTTKGLTVEPNQRNNVWREVLSTPFFNMRHLGLTEKEKIALDGTSFHGIFAIEGEAEITVGAVCKKCAKGVSCLIPATADTHYTVKPSANNTELLITTL
jgi:mannose-6-phosphate isomerase